MDPETDRMPPFGGLKQRPMPPEKKRPFEGKDRWLVIPSIQGCNPNALNQKSGLPQDESHPLSTLPKHTHWRTDSESPCKSTSISPVLKPLVREGNLIEKRPYKPQIASPLKCSNNSPVLRQFKTEVLPPGLVAPDKIRDERQIKTFNPRMLGQRLERLAISPVLDKKGGSPLLRNEFNVQKKISFDAAENSESIHLNEKARFTIENNHQMPEIHMNFLSDRRNSGTKCPNQEEERKKSSLKSRFIEAKTQEAELGQRLLPQENLSDKRKQNGNKQELDSIVQAAENLSLSKKYQSPVLYEIRSHLLGRGRGLEQDDKRSPRLEETIQDEFDQPSLNLTHRGEANEQSCSVLNSYSTSGSKESTEKRKSTSVDRSCSFILRKERHLRRSSGKTLSNSYSSNNSDQSGNYNKKYPLKQNDNAPVVTNTERESINKELRKKELVPQEEDKTQHIEAYQGLFASNNTTITQPVFKEFNKTENKFQAIIEEEQTATEDKNSHSGRSSLSESNKKENEKFGKLVEWKIGDFIGCGSHGEVYKAMEIHTGRIIALKKMMCIGSLLNESIGAELSILQKLKHENTVQYLGHEVLGSHLYIYMEYVSGGSISSIYSRYGPLNEKTIKVYAKQILSGLQYLHENGVIHKDIKGANILIHKDGTVKLSDFGCSSEIERTLYSLQNPIQNGLKGSVPWMAPEVVKETGFGRRSDIWSFGCTILEMATGKCPWSQCNFENQITLMMKIALSEEIPLIPETLSQDLKDFIGLCLKRDKDKRPYAADLLSHKFLTG